MRVAQIVTGLLDLLHIRSDAISEYLLKGRYVGSFGGCIVVTLLLQSGSVITYWVVI
jgi:hypothetical protein